MDIRVAGVVNDSIVDGPGLRVAVFVQGCPHRCPGCQNPQTFDFDGGELMTTDEIINKIERNPLDKGVTFSGGEPFAQAGALLEIARWCHANGKDVWAYSGYTYEQITEGKAGAAAQQLLQECDVLVDGPFIEAEKSMNLKWRGSANQRVIDISKTMQQGLVVLYC